MAGFGQIEAQVMQVGMVAEATCISKPWTIIPIVFTSVQDYIAAGQLRGGEQLIEAQQVAAPGTILVFMEPLYKGGLEGVTPGSSCVANAYTSNHELITSGKLGSFKSFGLHVVDATGFVHALLLRIQALVLPIKTLVLSGSLSVCLHAAGNDAAAIRKISPLLRVGNTVPLKCIVHQAFARWMSGNGTSRLLAQCSSVSEVGG
jgi:hypothetical protein